MLLEGSTNCEDVVHLPLVHSMLYKRKALIALLSSSPCRYAPIPHMCRLVPWLSQLHVPLPQGSYVSAPVVHPLRTFGPIEVLAPPNATEPLDFVANVMEDGIGESATELGDAVEHGAASSSKTVKAIIG